MRKRVPCPLSPTAVGAPLFRHPANPQLSAAASPDCSSLTDLIIPALGWGDSFLPPDDDALTGHFGHIEHPGETLRMLALACRCEDS